MHLLRTLNTKSASYIIIFIRGDIRRREEDREREMEKTSKDDNEGMATLSRNSRTKYGFAVQFYCI